jgi:predicted Na+-dependent transporter
MGIPLAMLIFGSRRDLSLILLPIMFYHPFQLFTNGLVANYWAKAGGGRPPSDLIQVSEGPDDKSAGS